MVAHVLNTPLPQVWQFDLVDLFEAYSDAAQISKAQHQQLAAATGHKVKA